MNNVHLYTSLLSIIYDKLDIVRRYGEDVTSFEERIESAMAIAESIDDPVSKSGNVAIQRLQNDTKYTEALNQLREIEKELDEYTKYLVLYFKNKSIENELHKSTLIDNIDDYRKEIEKLLVDARTINISSLTKGSELVKNIYRTAYEIIKIELIQNGVSKLLNDMIKNQMGIEFINDFVREDLENIDLTDDYNSDIKKRIDELSAKGINYSYADERLILSILIRSDSRVIDNINNKLEQLELKKSIYSKSNDNFIIAANNIEKSMEETKRKLKISRIKSLSMAFIMLINFGIYKAGSAISKVSNTDTQYMTTREVYDTISGETRISEELEYKSGSNEVIVKKYGEVSKSGSRKVVEYKLSDVELENIEDYVDYDLSGKTHTDSSKEYSMAEQLSKDSYTIVEKKTYSNEPIINFNVDAYNKFVMYLAYAMMAKSSFDAALLLRYIIISLINKSKSRRYQLDIEKIDEDIENIKAEEDRLKEEKIKLTSLKRDYISGKATVDDCDDLVYHKKKNKKKKSKHY